MTPTDPYRIWTPSTKIEPMQMACPITYMCLTIQMLKSAKTPDVRYHEYAAQGHVIDDFAYLVCPRAKIYECSACLYDRSEVRQLQKEFDDQWQQSTPDVSIRRLHL